VTALLALWLAFGDIAAVKAEPVLEKRSELALANADREMDAARKTYTDGDVPAMQSALGELVESVEVSYDALQHARTEPHKSKYYKHAELQLKALSRRLTGFRDEVSFESRAPVEAALKKISDVHDQLIADIMSRKK
jgi:hypothetical protein